MDDITDRRRVPCNPLNCWTATLLCFNLASTAFTALAFLLVLPVVASQEAGAERNLQSLLYCGVVLQVSGAFVVAGILALFGLRNRRMLLIPHIVLEAIFCTILFIALMFAFYLGWSPLAGVVAVILALNLATLVVVWKYYRSMGKQPETMCEPSSFASQAASAKQGYTPLPIQPSMSNYLTESGLPPSYDEARDPAYTNKE